MASKEYVPPKTALQQDYSFSVQEGHIIFRIGNASLHRKNEKHCREMHMNIIIG